MPADDPFDFMEPQAQSPAPDAAQPAPAPADPAPAPDAAPAVDGAPAAQPQGEGDRGPIPLPVFLDMRDKEKQARREADDLRKRVAEFERQQKPQPTVYDDPVQWQQQFEQQRQAEMAQLRLEMLDQFAIRTHGEETVKAARNWAASQAANDETFAVRMMSQADPVNWMVDQHRLNEQTTKLGGKTFEEAAAEWAKAQGLVAPVADDAAQPPAAQAVPATVASPPSPPAPPRSLASAPSAGRAADSGKITEKDIFGAAFK